MNNSSASTAEPHGEHHNYYSQQHQNQRPPAQEVTYHHQPYDPSQAQASNQFYYPYYQYEQYSDPQQHQYPYYSHQDYANAYSQHQEQQEPTSVHPPGVLVPPATTHMAASGQTHVQSHPNPYYPQGVVPQQQHNLYLGSGGLNAANTVFQEQHLGANIGGFGTVPIYGGLGPTHPPIGQSSYRGKSKRGGRAFKGGQDHFGPHGSSDPPFNGRGQAPTAQVHATPSWPPPCMAWCELCRVDCNTLEILEQHKSGKKHKKNLQRFEELQNLNKLITDVQMAQLLQMPSPQFKPEIIQPQKEDGSEEKQAVQHTFPPEAVIVNHVVEIEQQQCVEKCVAKPPKETERNLVTDRGRGGFKRSMIGGRGGKRMRINEWPRRSIEPPMTKVVIPLICELCNIRCESQVVFESHLAGKKHLSNLKRFRSYQAIGGTALHVFRPPNPNAPSAMFVPQVNQGVQGLFAQSVPDMLPDVKAPPVSALCLVDQNQANSECQSIQSISGSETKNAVLEENKSQHQTVMAESEPCLAVSTDAKIEKGSPESELKVSSLPRDNNSVVAPLESSFIADQHVLLAKAVDKTVSPDAEATASETLVVVASTDAKIVKGSSLLEGKLIGLPQESSFVAPMESSSLDGGQVLSAQAMDRAVSAQAAEVPTDQVVSEFDNRRGEPEMQGEE